MKTNKCIYVAGRLITTDVRKRGDDSTPYYIYFAFNLKRRVYELVILNTSTKKIVDNNCFVREEDVLNTWLNNYDLYLTKELVPSKIELENWQVNMVHAYLDPNNKSRPDLFEELCN